MPGGSLLFEDPPHLVDIYLPAAPTRDSGGGVKINWSSTPDQVNCPCSLNSRDGTTIRRQDREGNTIRNRIGFLTETLEVTLIPQTKFVTKGQDPGKTLIMTGFASPNRSYGDLSTDIPALTYVWADELR